MVDNSLVNMQPDIIPFDQFRAQHPEWTRAKAEEMYKTLRMDAIAQANAKAGLVTYDPAGGETARYLSTVEGQIRQANLLLNEGKTAEAAEVLAQAATAPTPTRNPLITQPVSPTSTPSTQEDEEMDTDPKTGTLTPQAQWRMLGYNPAEMGADALKPPPAGTPSVAEAVPEVNDTAQSKYAMMLEVANSELDEAEIPEADPFRPWFISRASKYWLESSQTFAFALAEDDYEATEGAGRADEDGDFNDNLSLQAQLEDLKIELKKQQEAVLAAQKAAVVQSTAQAKLAAIQSQTGEQREKSLEDFVKNVLPTLLAVGGGAAGLLAGGGWNLLMGGGGGGQPPIVAGGQAPAPSNSRLDQMMELMMMQMMQNNSYKSGYKTTSYSKRYNKYPSNYGNRRYNRYRRRNYD